MPKNALFLLKNCKIRRALGAPLPDSLPPAAEGFAPSLPDQPLHDKSLATRLSEPIFTYQSI